MTTLNIKIDLDEVGRTAMYEALCDEFEEKAINDSLKEQTIQQITQMFDNKDQLKQQAQQ